MVRFASCASLFPYTTLFRSRALRTRARRSRSSAEIETARLALFRGEGDGDSVGGGVDRDLAGEARLGLHGQRHRSEEHTSELQSLRHDVCRLRIDKIKEPSG